MAYARQTPSRNHRCHGYNTCLLAYNRKRIIIAWTQSMHIFTMKYILQINEHHLFKGLPNPSTSHTNTPWIRWANWGTQNFQLTPQSSAKIVIIRHLPTQGPDLFIQRLRFSPLQKGPSYVICLQTIDFPSPNTLQAPILPFKYNTRRKLPSYDLVLLFTKSTSNSHYSPYPFFWLFFHLTVTILLCQWPSRSCYFKLTNLPSNTYLSILRMR